MKKIMGIIIAVVTLFLCFTLSACGNKYVSKYSAVSMLRTNYSNKASVSFSSFDGTYVMHLKNKGDGEAFITYSGNIDDGNVKVYYDFNGEKLDLFELGTDKIIEGKTENFSGDKTIYIIIESDGKCSEGSFSFILKKAESN